MIGFGGVTNQSFQLAYFVGLGRDLLFALKDLVLEFLDLALQFVYLVPQSVISVVKVALVTAGHPVLKLRKVMLHFVLISL